jgi:hypothetical protein
MMDREAATSQSLDQAADQAPRRRRLGRRGLVAGGLSAVLVGCGVAAARYTSHVKYVGAGGDVTCQQQWTDPTTADTDALDQASSGGPALTGDPVADCQRYQKLTGRPPITDPVAFFYNSFVFVTPRSQVPASAALFLQSAKLGAARRELEASLGDWVDGAMSRCFSEAETTAFARHELARVGLGAWKIQVMPVGYVEPTPGTTKTSGTTNTPGTANTSNAATSPSAFGCTGVMVELDQETVEIQPNHDSGPDVFIPGGVDPFVRQLRDLLRHDIASRCLPLSQAQAIAQHALAGEESEPLTAVTDPSSKCTRVDMEVGGSIQVTLYGPGSPTS